MKKSIIVILLIASCCNALIAKPMGAAAQLMAFRTMEKSHKIDWINYMEKNTTTKSALLKKQIADWVDFGNNQINYLDGLKDLSNASKQEYFNKQLRDAISLHKSHIVAWKLWAKNHEEAAKKLCEKHDAELAKFEEQLGK